MLEGLSSSFESIPALKFSSGQRASSNAEGSPFQMELSQKSKDENFEKSTEKTSSGRDFFGEQKSEEAQPQNELKGSFKKQNLLEALTRPSKKKVDDSSMLILEDLQARQGLQQFVSSMKKDFQVGANDIYSALQQLEQPSEGPSHLSRSEQFTEFLNLSTTEDRAKAVAHFERWQEKSPVQDLAALLPLSNEEIREQRFNQGLERLQNEFFKPTAKLPNESIDQEIISQLSQEKMARDTNGQAPDLLTLDRALLMGQPLVVRSVTQGKNWNEGARMGTHSEIIEPFFNETSLKGAQKVGSKARGLVAYKTEQGFPQASSFALADLKMTEGHGELPRIGFGAEISQDRAAANSESSFFGPSQNSKIATDRLVNAELETQDINSQRDSTIPFEELVSTMSVVDSQRVSEPQSFILEPQSTTAQPVESFEALQRVQTLAQQGGGEMKMALNPEGLGQVQLKVSVQEGVVNVQMMTETAEAKELLSKGLEDLRSSLSAQNLNLDQLKVEVGGEISKQLDQSLDHQQREMAQQFLQDFRQGNDFFRRQFFEMDPLNPALRENDDQKGRIESSENTAKPRNRSSRLDLVA